MSSKRGKGSGPLSAAAGVIGVACLAWAAAGWLGLLGPGPRGPAHVPVRAAPEEAEAPVTPPAAAVAVAPAAGGRELAPVGVASVALGADAAAGNPEAGNPEPGNPEVGASHYPLGVGRYWVYRYEDPQSGAVARVERAVVGVERRDERDLYHFADGTVVYVEAGKVYELGADGGVNVIPLDPGAAAPYVYRSQGMQIAKHIGAKDTVLVAGGQHYEDCMEVITEFRALDRDAGPAISYSSFYARGVGLVGRERWPRSESRTLSVELNEHGTRQL